MVLYKLYQKLKFVHYLIYCTSWLERKRFENHQETQQQFIQRKKKESL